MQVKHAFVEYEGSNGLLQRMSGKQPITHSVLRDIQLGIGQGDWVTVFGSPGSGKSTFLRMLTGVIKPSKGKVFVNGKPPGQIPQLAAGYVSSEESEPAKETVSEILHAFGREHDITSFPARLGGISQALDIGDIMHRPGQSLSTTERLQLNIARAALSDSPLVLLDDVADHLGAAFVKGMLQVLFEHRTVVVATRSTDTAEALDLPILLLHKGSLAHYGTCEDIATTMGCTRVVDVWVEGLRYDLLRNLRRQAGVLEVRLLPTDQFDGQHLRISLRSSRYLPAMYDIVSQAPVIRIQELPPSLADIMARMR